MMTDLAPLLKERFGFDSFRPGQREAIESLLANGRLLCIQPTGYGKSLIYQLPALLVDGMTLVISPLLALMRDQIDQLNDRFGINAASINSDQGDDENAAAMAAAVGNQLTVLFIAPEKLDNLDINDFLRGLKIGLVVVDEAHCISTWGHDFRPSYRQIVKTVQALEERNAQLRILGLTATADARTEKDIAAQLADPLGEPLPVLRRPMDRPNLRLSVIPVQGLANKLERLGILLADLEGSGILYCATREQTEIVAEYLAQQGQDVVSYHAGYDPQRKRQLQAAFMTGKHKAIASTNALGMGIDKPDIRFIVHVDVPGSITAYYQEVGRAGRDGLPSDGMMLFDAADRRVQEYFIRSAQPSRDDFEVVLAAVEQTPGGPWPILRDIKVRSGLHPTRLRVVLAELMEQGYVEKKRDRGRQAYVPTGKIGEPDLQRYERQYKVRSRELKAMLDYGSAQVDCYMQALRRALGDVEAERCGRCSLCRPISAAVLDPVNVTETMTWLAERDVPIPASRRPLMAQGIAVLNGDMKTPLFVDFMRRRASAEAENELDAALLDLLARKLARLANEYQFGAVLPLPSLTWRQREKTAHFVAGLLDTRAYPDLLIWRQTPDKRQGELLNNDQRQFNVAQKMALSVPIIRPGNPPPKKAILLLDDYVGSAATLKEAVRALRVDGGFPADIVPFTVARIRWRLGQAGMI